MEISLESSTLCPTNYLLFEIDIPKTRFNNNNHLSIDTFSYYHHYSASIMTIKPVRSISSIGVSTNEQPIRLVCIGGIFCICDLISS